MFNKFKNFITLWIKGFLNVSFKTFKGYFEKLIVYKMSLFVTFKCLNFKFNYFIWWIKGHLNLHFMTFKWFSKVLIVYKMSLFVTFKCLNFKFNYFIWWIKGHLNLHFMTFKWFSKVLKVYKMLVLVSFKWYLKTSLKQHLKHLRVLLMYNLNAPQSGFNFEIKVILNVCLITLSCYLKVY